jgi:protein involved in polysaccharide export with SLBB domain
MCNSSLRFASTAALVAALALCSVTGFAQMPPAPAASAPPPLQVPGVNTAAPATRTATAPTSSGVSVPNGYVLAAGDVIAVEVFGEEDLRASVRVGADGVVSLPLLGAVRVGGLSLPQATSRLTELYARDYLVNPKLNVALVGFAKQRFSVLGQVNRPGSFEMPEGAGSIDILEAVAIAGGYTRIAAPERISIRRRTATGDEVIRVNAKQLAKRGGGFRVQPGDTVTVGESIF